MIRSYTVRINEKKRSCEDSQLLTFIGGRLSEFTFVFVEQGLAWIRWILLSMLCGNDKARLR